jgi:CheY-like chemotaxis protein
MTRSVLIVEDEPLIANHIKSMVEVMGFSVFGMAASGEEALSLCCHRVPAVALVDILLTWQMDGVDLARRLRTLGVPSVFLSALNDPEVMRKALEVSPYFLDKPFVPSKVFNTLDKIFGLRDARAGYG